MIKSLELTKIFTDKKRGQVFAVNKASFEISPGEIFGLLGLNGAGKTTTLRLLAGLLKPNSGTAYICGIDVVKQPEKSKAKLGFLTGTTGLYGRLKANEMIRYFGQLYGMSKSETDQRLDELMEILGMTEFAETRCDKLSSGTKQKVSIARTMIHDPIIFSTHIMHEAEKLCDRIGVIHEGRIIDIGTPDELKNKTGCADMDDAFVKMVGNNNEKH